MNVALQERRLTSLSSGPSSRFLYPQKPLQPYLRRYSRQTVVSASSLNTADPAPLSLTDTLRRILKLPPRPQSPSGVDERYRVFLDEWDKGFMDAEECPEGSWLPVIYGEIPKELQGTLFRNGPGKFTLGGKKIDHPYDGDGFVASVAFKDGAAFYRSRFVQTPEYEAEAAAQEVLFRGTFATQRSGGAGANIGDLYIKNTSNTNVMAFGDRLWTLFEAGQPYRLDPATLSTIGPELLDGYIKAGLPFDLGSQKNNSAITGFQRLAQGRNGPSSAGAAASSALPDELLAAGGDAVTAHPHICPITGRLVMFSYRVRPAVPYAPGQPPSVTDITFFELEESTMKPVVQRKYTLPGFAFLHDFALTENYYVIFQNPVTVDNTPYLLGNAPAASCVRWVPNTPTRVHLIPRPRAPSDTPSVNAAANATNFSTKNGTTTAPSDEAIVFSAPPLFVFHHANAFETDNGRRIVIDSIHYDSLPAVGREALAQQAVDPDAAFSSRLRRVEIDLQSHVLRVRCAFDGYLEMPAVNPRVFSQPHKYVYGYHSIFEDPQIALAKVNVEAREVEVWKPGKYRFALEPRFIPRQGTARAARDGEEEDDGWIIAQLFDSEEERSEIVILDAKDLQKGPVAVVALPHALPSALHSCWTDSLYGHGGVEKNEFGVKEQANVVLFGDAKRVKGSGERRDSMPRASKATAVASNSKTGNGVGSSLNSVLALLATALSSWNA